MCVSYSGLEVDRPSYSLGALVDSYSPLGALVDSYSLLGTLVDSYSPLGTLVDSYSVGEDVTTIGCGVGAAEGFREIVGRVGFIVGLLVVTWGVVG